MNQKELLNKIKEKKGISLIIGTVGLFFLFLLFRMFLDLLPFLIIGALVFIGYKLFKKGYLA